MHSVEFRCLWWHTRRKVERHRPHGELSCELGVQKTQVLYPMGLARSCGDAFEGKCYAVENFSANHNLHN